MGPLSNKFIVYVVVARGAVISKVAETIFAISVLGSPQPVKLAVL